MNTTQENTEHRQSVILRAWDAPGHVVSNMNNCLPQRQMQPENQDISLCHGTRMQIREMCQRGGRVGRKVRVTPHKTTTDVF